MEKIYTDKSVYDASQERIAYLFDHFDNVVVAFSGGKDSGVCLNMVYDYAKEHGMLDKVGMYHLDYEAQYQMTTDYVTETFAELDDIKRFWLCLPIGAQCACAMDSDRWIPWDRDKKDIWVREMPTYDYVINEDNVPFQMQKGEMDYDIQNRFCEWYAETHGSTAMVIGIRATESLNRFRAIQGNGKVNMVDGKRWTTKINDSLAYAYPIYDWETSDIWVYNAKFMKKYNHLYDLFYQAGMSIDQMRVASPFNDCAGGTLRYYKVIDPENWGKMVGRVNGVNMMGLYGGTTAMGWKNITKPDNFTWKEYANFLLNTLPEDVRNHYLEKLGVSKRFWSKTGGALDAETISELKAENAPATYTGETTKRSKSGKEVVRFDDYMDDTTVTNFKSIPTYKRLCVCIIKNDYCCKYMGFTQTKAETEKRKKAIEKYKNI